PIRDDYTAKWRSWRPCARATGIGVSSDADLEFPLQQLGQGRESAADTFAVEHCMGRGQGKYQLVLFVGERDLVDDAGAADRKHVTRPNCSPDDAGTPVELLGHDLLQPLRQAIGLLVVCPAATHMAKVDGKRQKNPSRMVDAAQGGLGNEDETLIAAIVRMRPPADVRHAA